MVFNEVEINNFRGIKHLLLPDLKQVNLLVGKIIVASLLCLMPYFYYQAFPILFSI